MSNAGEQEVKYLMKTHEKLWRESPHLKDASKEKLKDWMWITFSFHTSKST